MIVLVIIGVLYLHEGNFLVLRYEISNSCEDYQFIKSQSHKHILQRVKKVKGVFVQEIVEIN